MKNNSNYLFTALGISFTIHLVAFTASSGLFNYKIVPTVHKKEVKITPRNIEKIIENRQDVRQLKYLPPYVASLKNTEVGKSVAKPALAKPYVQDDGRKEISLPDIQIDQNLKKIPAYMDYYRLIRETIRNNAYSFYATSDEGEVLLGFVVLSTGKLENIYVSKSLDDKEMLEEIAIKSVERAAPFPAFPEELNNYSRLQFNISIYFKNR